MENSIIMEIQAFRSGSIEAVSRIVGELYTGSQLTKLLYDTGIARYDSGAPRTKWARIAEAVGLQQSHQQDGRPLIKLLSVAFDPRNLLNSRTGYDSELARNEINAILSLDGFLISENGKIRRTSKASTVKQAKLRSTQLKEELEQRGAHTEVLKHCRPELLHTDYYEAAFESIKGLGERLQELSSLDLDGRELCQAVFGGKKPILRVNSLKTTTDKNEQTGTLLLAEGVFSAFRNPAAHEPRLNWHIGEQDALDIMGLVSLIHRRVDTAEHLQNIEL